MNNPLFSIITCTYNSEKYLKDNIDSVENQTYKDFEHVFIDGESNDQTLGLINQYSKKNINVKILKSNPHGISNAMNIGFRAASGKYIIFLHSDDLFYSSSVLEDVAYFIKNNDYDWIYGQIEVFDDNKIIGLFPRKKLLHANNKNLLKKYLLKFYNYIPHQAVFIKKQILEEYNGFDETISSAMDPDLWLKIKNSTSWTYIPLIISKYRLHRGSQSSAKKNLKVNKENSKIVAKRYLNKIEMQIYKIVNILLENKHNYK
ncbi:MAG: Glycosyltransferase, group 2 family protein [Parcubacteria group bacterium GW2011_GWE2_38_18]|nr:MAG: Glycosyltransferase, group 2 family protein [Parcubacteria group bacterium GW2011_GWE2_38_18]